MKTFDAPNTTSDLDPISILAAIDHYFATVINRLRAEQDQVAADLQIVELDERRAALDARRRGDDPDADENVRRLRRLIDDRRARLDSLKASVDYQRTRAEQMKTRGPAVLRRAMETQAAVLRALIAVQPLFDAANAARKEAEAILAHTDRHGVYRIVGMPRRINGGAPFPVVHALEEFFDRSVHRSQNELDRIIDDARDAGLSV